jgi:hypothetical protein
VITGMIEADLGHLRRALEEGERVEAHGLVDAIIDSLRRLEDLTSAKINSGISPGDTIKIIKEDGIHPSVVDLVRGRSGMVTEIVDRGDVIARFWDDDRRPFEKRFRADEVGLLV